MEAIHDIDNRLKAKQLYFDGYRVKEIARKLGEKAPTVHSWKRRDQWEDTPTIQRVESSIDLRLTKLIAKEDKTDRDLREIDVLSKALERTARVKKYQDTGKESDLNPKIKNRNRGPKRQPRKNYLDDEQVEKLVEAFDSSLFDYQKKWKEAGLTNRIRNILKSRQIGATWYFAREALIDALTTGRNQVFLSASKAQAQVFKLYILQFVQDVTGVELKGDPIVLANGATLYFLGTNARTAQSYHGNVYIDEYFWIPRFKEFRKVASGMAMHKKWRQTYISTPSALSHEAYPFWNGEHFNRGRPKKDHITLDVSKKNLKLKQGMKCPDGQWRQIVTVEDALAGGCNLFDIDQLRIEYSDDEYNNLLMCDFIDDNASVFTLSQLQACMVDALMVWSDVRPFAPRPFGDRPVWIGYDPSRTRDDAALVVVAPPSVDGGKFRVIEKITMQNLGFDKQAEVIKKLTQKYTVQHIGIDTTGIGYGVYDLVKAFFPGTKQISYNPEVKTRLVLKAQSVITNGRLEYDAGDKDIAVAFMSIRKTTTPSGNRVTYEAVRSETAGHADLAWAIMHALDFEPLQGITQTNKTIVEIY